jgi:transcriptional regulator of arginine metabolism
MKARRQQVILDLVSKERLSSQEEIRSRLAAAGIAATQSTISRDIEELGLARLHDQAGLRYVAPGDVNGNGGNGGSGNGTNGHRPALRRLLQEFAVSMTPSGNVLVITTPPGAAHLLAEGLDHAGIEEMAGTVAGDNTIMAISREGVSAISLEEALNQLMKENGQ